MSEEVGKGVLKLSDFQNESQKRHGSPVGQKKGKYSWLRDSLYNMEARERTADPSY